eukprot:6694127-Pyramimonas_sp.AAC.1
MRVTDIIARGQRRSGYDGSRHQCRAWGGAGACLARASPSRMTNLHMLLRAADGSCCLTCWSRS